MSKEALIIFSGLGGEEYHPDAGGIQLAEYSFCEYAHTQGWNISAVVGTSNNRKLPLLSTDVNVTRVTTIPYRYGGITDALPFSLTAASIAIDRATETESIIHFTSLVSSIGLISNPSFAYLKGAQKIKGKFFYTLHNYHYAISTKAEDIFENYPEEWDWLHNQEKIVVRQADVLVVPCKNYQEELTNKFNREIVYLPNTIGERKKYTVESIPIDGYDVLLCLSRLTKGKNIDLVLVALSEVLNENPKVRLILAGDGEEQPGLYYTALERGLNPILLTDEITIDQIAENFKNHKVIFRGRVNQKQKIQILNTADCFIQLSVHEVSPLVGLENLVYGNRMLVTDIPGWRDYLERGADISTTDLIIEDIAEAILRAVNKVRRDKQITKEKNFKVYDDFYAPNITVPRRLKCYEQSLSL